MPQTQTLFFSIKIFMENNKLDIYKKTLTIRRLNIIEKSTVINKLLDHFHLPPEKVIKEYLPLLEIPAHNKYLQNYLWLNKLSGTLKAIIIDRDIDIDILLKTKEWPADIREETLPLILSFQLGKNKTAELLSLLNEVSLTERQEIREILTSAEWSTIRNNPKLSLPQKGMKLREILQTKRFPIYKEYEKRLKQLITALDLPPGLKLNAKDLLTLEKDSITFNFECSQTEDLKLLGKYLQRLGDTKEITQFLNLLRDKEAKM